MLGLAVITKVHSLTSCAPSLMTLSIAIETCMHASLTSKAFDASMRDAVAGVGPPYKLEGAPKQALDWPSGGWAKRWPAT